MTVLFHLETPLDPVSYYDCVLATIINSNTFSKFEMGNGPALIQEKYVLETWWSAE